MDLFFWVLISISLPIRILFTYSDSREVDLPFIGSAPVPFKLRSCVGETAEAGSATRCPASKLGGRRRISRDPVRITDPQIPKSSKNLKNACFGA